MYFVVVVAALVWLGFFFVGFFWKGGGGSMDLATYKSEERRKGEISMISRIVSLRYTVTIKFTP